MNVESSKKRFINEIKISHQFFPPKHVEEILGYLQVCVKVEPCKTFLCVQQVSIHSHWLLIKHVTSGDLN